MEMIVWDLHKRESQLAIKVKDETITDRRIVTSWAQFTAVFLGARLVQNARRLPHCGALAPRARRLPVSVTTV